MGYYTAIHFDGKLKRNIPEHVIKTLKYMLDAYATLETSRDQIPFPLNEDGNPSPLAHTDRWNSLFVMSSAYFHAETESYMQQVRDDTYLHVVANLKNYDDEIEKFMCWIAPFIEAEANSWIGFALTEDEILQRGIDNLPTSLWEAYHALEEDDVVKNALGEKVFDQFYTIKRAEWDAYRIQVFDYERDQYLDV